MQEAVKYQLNLLGGVAAPFLSLLRGHWINVSRRTFKLVAKWWRRKYMCY